LFLRALRAALLLRVLGSRSVLESAGGGSGTSETCRLLALGLRATALHARRRRNTRRWQNSQCPFFWWCERWRLRRLGVARVCSVRGGGGSGGTSSWQGEDCEDGGGWRRNEGDGAGAGAGVCTGGSGRLRATRWQATVVWATVSWATVDGETTETIAGRRRTGYCC
jgi:hypothetical protein